MLRAVAVVSLDVTVASVEVVAVVEVDEMVSFLTGGEADPLWRSCSCGWPPWGGADCDSGLPVAGRLEPFRDSSLFGGASDRLGAEGILSTLVSLFPSRGTVPYSSYLVPCGRF